MRTTRQRAAEPSTSATVGLDPINRRYTIPCGGGYTCLGYDFAHRRAKAVAEWAHLPPPTKRPGTLTAYEEYERIMLRGAAFATQTRSRCPAELTPQLVGLEYRRVEVFDDHGHKRRFTVGKSTGWLPCHLELHNRASNDGIPVYGAPFISVRVIK